MKAALGWVVAGVLMFLVVLGAGENQRASARHARVADSLRAVSDAALFSLDTIKARSAEREIGDQKHADSLRRVIATARNRPPITLRDTVESYVFITDSIIPKCVVCAARLDSAVVAARAEREAASLTVDALSAEKEHFRETVVRLERRRTLNRWLMVGGFIGSAVLGAWLRGQP